MKRKIRIDFCDIGCNQSKINYFLYWVLAERFDLDLCDQPDFLVHNLFGHEHRLHSGVRVMYMRQPFLPNDEPMIYFDRRDSGLWDNQ